MKTWKEASRDAAWTGGLAGAASLAALAWRGRRETGSVFAPVNAPSQWVWRDRALRADGPSWRYTGVGLAVHQGAAYFWGLLYERFIAPRGTVSLAADLRDAAVATAAAATVDFVMTPPRFTPGFEKRLSVQGLVWVYAGFALGVALGSRMARRP
jgi:hypothetical protein